MTAAPVTIVCANCGAKYKLPADFKSASAKCKGCGATIDVASQLKAAAAPPAAPKPAAKAPTPQPSKASASTRDGARRERSSASGSASSSRRSSGSSSRRSRDGAKEPSVKKSGKGLLIGSAVGIVALGVVGYFVLTGSGQTPDPAVTNAVAASGADASVKDAALTKPDAMPDASKTEPDAPAKELPGGAAPATAGDKPEDPKPTAKKPAKAPVTKPTEEKKPLTAADVFDPRTLPPLEFPAYVEAPQREEIKSLCEDLRNGGMSGRRAKTRLEEIGHPALTSVINAYAQIDFKSPDQAMYAFEMNKLLTNAFGAGVVSANFKPTQAGEEIPLETADWNAKTVNAWRRFGEGHSDKAVWESMIATRKEGKGAAGANRDKAKDDDK